MGAPKGQKHLAQGSALGFVMSGNGAPKGQKHLAQGSALGFMFSEFVRREGAKALIELRKILELLPLQGELYHL